MQEDDANLQLLLGEKDLAESRLKYAKLKRAISLRPEFLWMNDEAVESNEQQAKSHTGDPLNNKRTQIVLRKSFILGGQNPQGGNMKQWSNEQQANGHGGGPLERQEVSNEDHPLCLGKASVWHNYFEKFESRYTVTWKEHSPL